MLYNVVKFSGRTYINILVNVEDLREAGLLRLLPSKFKIH